MGRQIFASYPGSAAGTSLQYDALGRVIRRTHGDGTFRTYAYASGGQVETDERGLKTSRVYRAYGDPPRATC